MKREDLTDHTFGRLRVIKPLSRTQGGHKLYLCECMCGGKATVRACDLKSGNTRSCGCLKGDKWKRIIDKENQMSGMERALERWRKSLE